MEDKQKINEGNKFGPKKENYHECFQQTVC